MTSRSAFRCAGGGPAVTHPSTDPAKSCLTCVIAWHRTPTTHRALSVRFQYFIYSNICFITQSIFRFSSFCYVFLFFRCLALPLFISRRRVYVFSAVSSPCLRFGTMVPSYRWYTALLS